MFDVLKSKMFNITQAIDGKDMESFGNSNMTMEVFKLINKKKKNVVE
jgi:hypothetical protein